MFGQRGTLRVIDVVRPFLGVGVRAPTKPRKQVELQVVVSVDQSRQNKVALEVNLDTGVRRGVPAGARIDDLSDASVLDFKVCPDGVLRSRGYPSSGQTQGRKL